MRVKIVLGVLGALIALALGVGGYALASGSTQPTQPTPRATPTYWPVVPPPHPTATLPLPTPSMTLPPLLP
jgi:hypothetical protein